MDPLTEAAYVYAHVGNYTKQQKFDAAASLSEWGAFSLRQVGQIVGLSHTTVRRIAKHKPDRTGGSFSPECLAPLLEIQKRYQREESVEPGSVRAMLDAGSGTSAYFAAKLSGIKESWMRKHLKERSKNERHGRTDSVAGVPVADEPGAHRVAEAGEKPH